MRRIKTVYNLFIILGIIVILVFILSFYDPNKIKNSFTGNVQKIRIGDDGGDIVGASGGGQSCTAKCPPPVTGACSAGGYPCGAGACWTDSTEIHCTDDCGEVTINC